MQAYIREHETEKLLDIYYDLQSMAENIKLQMSSLENSKASDDNIEAMALKHLTFGDVPSYSKGTASDRTAKVALSYKETLDTEIREGIEELQNELQLIEVIIAKVEISLAVLTPIQKEIVMLRYCKGLKWGEIDCVINRDEYLMSVSAMKAKAKEAIQRMTKVCRIRVSEYMRVMELFN